MAILFFTVNCLESDGYHPGYARIVLEAKHIKRIRQLQQAISEVDATQIRDGAHGPHVEWFDGDGEKAEVTELVVEPDRIYWTALPPEEGAPFETAALSVTELDRIVGEGGTHLIGEDSEDLAEVHAAYLEYCQ